MIIVEHVPVLRRAIETLVWMVNWLGIFTVILRRVALVALLANLLSCAAAHADITVQRIPIDNAPPILLLEGEFTHSDDPQALAREVAASGAKVLTFESGGGNVVSAMAFGRTIRSLGLTTLVHEDDRHAPAVVEAVQFHEGRRFAQVLGRFIAHDDTPGDIEPVAREQVLPPTHVGCRPVRPLHLRKGDTRLLHEEFTPVATETAGDDPVGGSFPQQMLPVEW